MNFSTETKNGIFKKFLFLCLGFENFSLSVKFEFSKNMSAEKPPLIGHSKKYYLIYYFYALDKIEIWQIFSFRTYERGIRQLADLRKYEDAVKLYGSNALFREAREFAIKRITKDYTLVSASKTTDMLPEPA